MSLTPDAILALLALLVMLAPACRFIYRFVQRHRPRPRPRLADEEAAGMCNPQICLQSTFRRPLQWPQHINFESWNVSTDLLLVAPYAITSPGYGLQPVRTREYAYPPDEASDNPGGAQHVKNPPILEWIYLIIHFLLVFTAVWKHIYFRVDISFSLAGHTCVEVLER